MTTQPQQFMLTQAAREGHCEDVLDMIHRNPTATKFTALFEAIKHGHRGCVDVLLGHMNESDLQDVHKEGGLLLYVAVEFKRWDFFHKVFPLVHPEELEVSLFSSVVRSGNTDCFLAVEPYLPEEWNAGVVLAVQSKNIAALELLVPKYGLNSGRALFEAVLKFDACPQIIDVLTPYATPNILNRALCQAVSRQHSLVPKLLTMCHPKDHDNEAFKNALAYGFFEMAALLAPLSDPQRVLMELLEHEPDAQAIAWLDEWIAQDLNARLHTHVEEQYCEPVNKTQRKI